MAQVASLNSKSTTFIFAQEPPCYKELIECIQTIWNRLCAWISELASQLFSWKENIGTLNLAPPNRNCFDLMLHFLEPDEVARCERVAKSWKIEKIWQDLCAHYGVTEAPESGRFKELFEVPKMAFGPRDWRKHFGNIGCIPPLPTNIKSQIAKLENTHILTLIPKIINGQELSFNTLVPLAKKAGIRLVVWKTISTKYGNEVLANSLWVWMQKDIEADSYHKTQAQAEKDYPQKLGKGLFYVVSIIAHYARYKIFLFSKEIVEKEDTYVRTRDGGEDTTGDSWDMFVMSSTLKCLELNVVDSTRSTYSAVVPLVVAN